MPSPPIPYSPEVEDVRPDEAETVAGLCTAFDTILERTAAHEGHAIRSVHAKAHAVLEGTFTVDDGLPPELAQGMFAAPGAHRAYLRVSTNAGDLLPDSVSLPRGVALKVLDVPGERLPGAEGGGQDFIMVNGTVFQARDAKAFLGSLKLLAATTDRAEGAKVAASTVLRGVNKALRAVGIDSATLGALGGAPNVDPLGETYHSLTAFRYGAHVAKFALVPVAPALTALTGREIDASGRPDAIRETLRAEMSVTEAVWEFHVQLCRDLARQPVEDPTVEWDEAEAPFQRVATLAVPRQDSWDPARVRAVDEAMRFSVWTGLAAHRPLGDVNRAREATYRHSADFRQRYNGCPIHEPAGGR